MTRKKKSNKKRKGKSSQQPPPPTPPRQGLENEEGPLNTTNDDGVIMPDTGSAVLDMVVFFKQCVDKGGEEAAKTYQPLLDMALKNLVDVYTGPDAPSAPSLLDDDYFSESYSGSDQEC